MYYGLIKNSVLELAPRIINHVLDPSDDVYISCGYLPIITSEEPTVESHQYAIPLFHEENGQIVQTWSVEEIPDEATESDYITALQDLGVDVDG